MPLSESEMQRLQEEEIYRQEVRARLERNKPSRTKREKAWEFFNSPLALWLLSTVVVGLVTLAYTNYQSSVKEAEEQRQVSQKLNAEINNRRKETLKLLAYINENSNDEYYDPRWIYKTCVNFLDGDKDPALTAYQPVLEFKEKNWATLLSDLEKASGPEMSDLTSFRAQYDSLKTLWTQTPPSTTNAKPTPDDSKKTVEAVKQVENIISPPRPNPAK